MVYSVKSVAVIPLIESRAQDTLRALGLKNHTRNRPSLMPPESLVSTRGSVDDATIATPDESGAHAPRVKFATEEQVKVMSPLSSHGFETQQQDEVDPARSPSPSSSLWFPLRARTNSTKLSPLAGCSCVSSNCSVCNFGHRQSSLLQSFSNIAVEMDPSNTDS